MTNKLTAEVALRDIGHLKSYQSLSLREELYLQALEIALPVLEQQEMITDSSADITDKTHLITENNRQADDCWIDWGGEMALPPVANEVMVEVRLRSGTRMSGLAKSFRWRHHQNDYDIIAYRVIKNDGREG